MTTPSDTSDRGAGGDTAEQPSVTLATPLHEGPGTRIGRYKLLQLIGEGGFGSVFMAEQEKPVSRKVALKIIKLGMDTRQVIARFEAERQALALMNHPNIARVLDAGATDTGRPYFVMELCKGDPIVEYCDKNNLTIEDRLELFAQVCQAVQHAHTKGVIHRDIKPSNILVSTQDSRPHAKVIDFGIAKATESKLTEKTLFTEHRALIGTPEYMSPEQAEGSLDIDTRTDVYSLGVLLYELLTGTTPFSSRELRSAAYAEIQRIIREVDPPRPSTRLSHNTGTLASVAAHRHTEPKKLGTIVRGDLDWIVMKSLEKDRARRYETANGLAMDVRRYLTGEAVLAAPPSTAYRMRKFVRRHRARVAAAGLVAIALMLGLAGTVWQAKVASDQAEAATKAEAQAKAARDAEKARADELNQVADFQQKMLSQVDPAAAGVRLTEDLSRRFAAALVKAKVPTEEQAGLVDRFRKGWSRVNATDAAAALIDETILKPAVKAVDEQFKDQPEVDAQLRQALADRYRGLGLLEKASPLQKQALEIRRRVLGAEHPETIESIHQTGVLLGAQGRFDEAEPYYREALEKNRRLQGEDHNYTLSCISSMGAVLQGQGKFDQAEPYTRQALEKHRRLLGEEHPDTIQAINNMGDLLASQGKLDQAEPLLREALEKSRRVLGEEHLTTLTKIGNMGNLSMAQGKLDQAELYYREALEKRRRVLGEEHPDTITSIGAVGILFLNQGKLLEAEQYCREVMEKSRRVLGEDHPSTLMAIDNMGALCHARGRFTEAESYCREAMEKYRRVLGEDHLDAIIAVCNVGSMLLSQDKGAQAEPYFREAVERFRRVLGDEHPYTLASMNNLGSLLLKQGKLAEAEPYFREALEKRRRVLGMEHPDTLASTVNLGGLLRAQGKFAEVIALLEPIESKARAAFTGGNAARLVPLLTALGRSRAALDFDPASFAVAEANLLEAYSVSVKIRGEKHKEPLDCARGLIDLYAAWNKAEPGKGFDDKAAEWKAKLDAAPSTPNSK